MRIAPLALAAATLLGLACADDVARESAAEAARFEQVAQLVLPDPAEDAWRELAWIPVYADAVIAAEAQQRPALMWAMNGHPLGCT